MASFYSESQQASSRALSALQLPVLGAGAAAAGIALDGVSRPASDTAGANNALRQLGQIGIITGVFTLGRDQLLPSRLPSLYIGGYRAMVCIVSEEPAFLADSAISRHNAFVASLRESRDAVGRLRAAIGGLSIGEAAEAADLVALAEAQVLLSAAGIKAAESQIAQYERKEAVFQQAISDASASVTRGALVSTPMDLTTVRSALEGSFAQAGAAKSPKAASSGSGAPAPMSASDNLRAAINAASRAAGGLEGATIDYGAILTRVAACPARAVATG